MKNSGKEIASSEAVEATRSSARSRYTLERMPSKTPSGSAIVAASAASDRVAPRRGAISSAIGRSLASERPKSPRSKPAVQSA